MELESLYKQLYKSSLRYLGIRLRSEREMRDKLKEWLKKNPAIEEQTALELEDRVVKRLYSDHFLDDKRFAEEWISSRMRSKPRGEYILRMELLKKGIARFVIDSVVEDLLYKSSGDDTSGLQQMALKAGEKYLRKLAGEDGRALKFKLSQALARKGFEGSIIRSVVDELLDKRYNTSE
jgi:regulatory protein